MKYLIPVLALAGSVIAQTSTVCNGPSITISSDADASQIATCSTYDGDIIIDSSASGSIDISGVQQVTGSFTCKNATALSAITASSLTEIGGTFDLESLTVLSTLNMPYLQGVNKIYWVALPALQTLSFATGISKSNSVYISNTQLNTLEGIELAMVGSIDVNNNPYLNEINVNALTNITSALSFSANGNSLSVEFPHLQNAGNLTFRNVSSVSIPSLSTVGGAIGLYSDYLQNFSAPNLSTIGGSLAIIDNAQLTTFSFPQLTQIGGGFIVVNNSQLAAINGAPKLVTVVGAINFVGTFSDITANALKDVRGGAVVTTSSQNTSICDEIKAAGTHQIIKGKVVCTNGVVTAQTNGTSTTNSSSGSTKNAASSLSMAPIVPFTTFFGFLAYMLL